MARWPGLIIALAVLCFASALGVRAAIAATLSRMDILSDDAVHNSGDTIDVGKVEPIAKPAQPASRLVQRGNPLWSVPLSALIATEERPIFSATRRPPPRAIAASAVEGGPAPPPKPAEDLLPLVLVGAVVGEGAAIAILMDRTDQKVIRLRQGESRGGWSLSTVQPREVTFKHGDRSEVLALQRLDAPAVAGGGSVGLADPAGKSAPFAPIVPRATPWSSRSSAL